MTSVLRLWPLLTATHRYDKSLSTRNRGRGETLEAPILAYLVETTQGRILYDVGCDYAKIADPARRARHYDPRSFAFGPPEMEEGQRIPHHLARLGLTAADLDVVFVSHLHFDHAGGLADLPGCETHVQRAELAAAASGEDPGVFADELDVPVRWRVKDGEYELAPGVTAIATPGHTDGHMSLWIELPQGAPVVLCGDAADLRENIDDEIAPGLLWRDDEARALASIRKLKRLGRRDGAELWPNHDMAFYRGLRRFPEFHS